MRISRSYELYFHRAPPTKLLLISVSAIAARIFPLISTLLKTISFYSKIWKLRECYKWTQKEFQYQMSHNVKEGILLDTSDQYYVLLLVHCFPCTHSTFMKCRDREWSEAPCPVFLPQLLSQQQEAPSFRVIFWRIRNNPSTPVPFLKLLFLAAIFYCIFLDNGVFLQMDVPLWF